MYIPLLTWHPAPPIHSALSGFFPSPFSLSPYWRHGAESSSSLRVSSPGSCVAPWLVTAYICVFRAHCIAVHLLPWPHLGLWIYSMAYVFSRGQNWKESVHSYSRVILMHVIYAFTCVFKHGIFLYMHRTLYMCRHIWFLFVFLLDLEKNA